MAGRANDVFVLGAGFSKAISPSMPLMYELSECVSPNNKQYFVNDFEQRLTYLSQFFPWKSEKEYHKDLSDFLDLTDKIKVSLQKVQNEVLQNLHAPWMLDLVESWHNEKSTIITFNYDTIIEQVLEKNFATEMDYCYPIPLSNPAGRNTSTIAGTPKDTFKLFKLHGSLNWYYSGNSSYFGETIYLDYSIESKTPYDQKRLVQNNLVDKVPLIVPPTTEKNSFFSNETIRSLWQLARIELSKAKRIYFFGYSLPQTDLMVQFMFNSSIDYSKCRIIVVNTDTTVLEKYRKLLHTNVNVFAAKQPENLASEFTTEYLGGRI